jgi:hypothetical protein
LIKKYDERERETWGKMEREAIIFIINMGRVEQE